MSNSYKSPGLLRRQTSMTFSMKQLNEVESKGLAVYTILNDFAVSLKSSDANPEKLKTKVKDCLLKVQSFVAVLKQTSEDKSVDEPSRFNLLNVAKQVVQLSSDLGIAMRDVMKVSPTDIPARSEASANLNSRIMAIIMLIGDVVEISPTSSVSTDTLVIPPPSEDLPPLPPSESQLPPPPLASNSSSSSSSSPSGEAVSLPTPPVNVVTSSSSSATDYSRPPPPTQSVPPPPVVARTNSLRSLAPPLPAPTSTASTTNNADLSLPLPLPPLPSSTTTATTTTTTATATTTINIDASLPPPPIPPAAVIDSTPISITSDNLLVTSERSFSEPIQPNINNNTASETNQQQHQQPLAVPERSQSDSAAMQAASSNNINNSGGSGSVKSVMASVSGQERLTLLRKGIQTSLSAFGSLAGRNDKSQIATINEGLRNTLMMVKQFIDSLKELAGQKGIPDAMKRQLLLSATAIIQASAGLANAIKASIKAVETNDDTQFFTIAKDIKGKIDTLNGLLTPLTLDGVPNEVDSPSLPPSQPRSSVSELPSPIPQQPPSLSSSSSSSASSSSSSSTSSSSSSSSATSSTSANSTITSTANTNNDNSNSGRNGSAKNKESEDIAVVPAPPMEEPLPPLLEDLPPPPPNIEFESLPPPPSLNELAGMTVPPPPIYDDDFMLSSSSSSSSSSLPLPPPPISLAEAGDSAFNPPPPPLDSSTSGIGGITSPSSESASDSTSAPTHALSSIPKLNFSSIPLVTKARKLQDLISQLCGSMSVMTLGFGGEKDYSGALNLILTALVDFADSSNVEIHQYEGVNDTDHRNHRQRLYQACSLIRSTVVQTIGITKAAVAAYNVITGSSNVAGSLRRGGTHKTNSVDLMGAVSQALQQLDAARKSTSSSVDNLCGVFQTKHERDWILQEEKKSRVKREQETGKKDNIWDQMQADDTSNISWHATDKDQIIAGSLNKLVERLAHNTYSDPFYMKVFITTCSSFASPREILEKLIQRYDVPDNFRISQYSNLSADDFEKQVAQVIRLRVGTALKFWIDNRFDDFDDEMIKMLEDFVNNKVSPSSKSLGEQLKKSYQKRIQSAASGEEEGPGNISRVAPPIIKQFTNAHVPDVGLMPCDIINTLMFPITELAKQITLLDFRLFRQIQPSELLNQAWSKSKYRYRSPNVINLVERFNRLSSWVATSILWQTTLKGRQRVYNSVMELNVEMYKLNNFHAIAAINAGLNNSAIHRLKFTLAGLDKKLLEGQKQLEMLMNPDSSYKSFRQRCHSINPPLLPFIGVYLRDLVFIEDGNPDMSSGLINFEKRKLGYRIISEIQQYQHISYGFPIAEPLQSYCMHFCVLPDQDLYELSMQYEPRGATEKQVLRLEKYESI